MQTIKHVNQDDSVEIYHGEVLKWINENTWIFGFRINGRNFEWECNKDYWELK